MTLVKICGLTNLEDAKLAVELGANALGFNFYSGSSRYLDVAEAQTLIRQIPPTVWRVGIFVNQARDEVEHIARLTGIDTLQFHGDESADFCRLWKSWRVIRALRPRSDEEAKDLVSEYRSAADHLLFDRYSSDAVGGTGKEIPESIVATLEATGALSNAVLSGGLTPDNVGEKVRKYRPFAVDVASGVELQPRKKSVALMQGFIEATKQKN